MSTEQAKSVTNKKTQKKDDESHVINNAVIVTQQLTQKILVVFDEMPRRYSQLIDPVVAKLTQCPIANVTLEKEEPKE